MAINYTNLFNDLREQVLTSISLEELLPVLEADRNAVITSMDTSGGTGSIDAVQRTYNTLISQVHSMLGQVVSMVKLRLQDTETVLNQLTNLSGTTGFDNVLYALIADMVDKNESVKKLNVSASAITKTTVNSGAGDLIISDILSGVTNPGQGFKYHEDMAGVDQEMSLTDVVNVVCTSDNQPNATIGSESFSIYGKSPQTKYPFDHTSPGNKGTGSLSAGSGNVLEDFESFSTSNTPDNWTISVGVAGTDFGEETTVVHTGSSALWVTDSFNLKRSILSLISPGEVYSIYFYARKETGATGSVNVRVYVNGVAQMTQTFSQAALSDSAWTLINYEFTVPQVIGTVDAYIEIEGVSISSGNFILDNFNMSEYTYWAGGGFLVTNGTQQYVEGDSFSFNWTNAKDGLFQWFFTRAFGRQLPSNASPTQADPVP